jgi:hypothetical protein
MVEQVLNKGMICYILTESVWQLLVQFFMLFYGYVRAAYLSHPHIHRCWWWWWCGVGKRLDEAMHTVVLKHPCLRKA